MNLKKINWVAVGSIAAVAGLLIALKPDILGGGGDFSSGKSGTVKGGLTPDSGETTTTPTTKKEESAAPASSGSTGYTPTSFGSGLSWDEISDKIKADMYAASIKPALPSYISEDVAWNPTKKEFTSKVDNPNAPYYNVPAVTNLGAGSTAPNRISYTVPTKKAAVRESDIPSFAPGRVYPGQALYGKIQPYDAGQAMRLKAGQDYKMGYAIF